MPRVSSAAANTLTVPHFHVAAISLLLLSENHATMESNFCTFPYYLFSPHSFLSSKWKAQFCCSHNEVWPRASHGFLLHVDSPQHSHLCSHMLLLLLEWIWPRHMEAHKGGSLRVVLVDKNGWLFSIGASLGEGKKSHVKHLGCKNQNFQLIWSC